MLYHGGELRHTGTAILRRAIKYYRLVRLAYSQNQFTLKRSSSQTTTAGRGGRLGSRRGRTRFSLDHRLSHQNPRQILFVYDSIL